MELRHLRYFVAIAEAGSFTQAAEKHLHTAQPSLSRQIRDLETDLGTQLIIRGPRGMDLTPAGHTFLDHARAILVQVEAARAATIRAAQPAKASFIVGFLTGYEIEFLPKVLAILGPDLRQTELVIHSASSPDLTDMLRRGKLDAAYLRPDPSATDLVFQHVGDDDLYMLLPANHRLAAAEALALNDVAGDIFVNFSRTFAPALRRIIDAYAARLGVTLTPGPEAETLPTVISLILSTGGVSLVPGYTKSLLPASVIARPLAATPPSIELALGYNRLNTARLLQKFVSAASHPQ